MNKICFEKEANDWNEALPIGNGFMGAMVFGNTNKERIQLNEDSVWSGGFIERTNPDAKENYRKVRQLLLDGKIGKAELLAERSMFATYPHMRHYQSLGDVWIDFFKQRGKMIFKQDDSGLLRSEHEGVKVKDYYRELDISEATGRIHYILNEESHQREFFASNPDQVIVYKMKAEEGKLDFDLSVTRKDNRPGRGASYCDGTEVLGEDKIRLYGKQGGDDGIAFELLVQVKITGGRSYKMGSHIIVEEAQEAVLYITARTTFRSKNPRKWCLDVLNHAQRKSYEELKANHIADYKKYYEQSSLKLKIQQSYDELPTPKRLEQMRNGVEDIELINTYYNYAKYLLISSSRLGSLPANLQGIWNEDFEPMWGSKYTININIEMNYWIAEKTGLSELHLPLMEQLKRMYPHGKKVAEKMYGIDGFCCHHNTDIWGDCAPQDNHVSATLWPMGGAWFCLHIIEHYTYTKDKEFITEHYPILRDSVKFFLQYMIKDAEGRWISGPSSSPENTYLNKQGESGCLCMGASMDTEIIKELFKGYLEITEENQYPDDLNSLVKEHLACMPELEIGEYGQIQEWSQDFDEVEPGHRHISQLFALYPADQIRMDKTPELAKAARNTIDRRLKYGGGHTGWSKAWITLFYTRLWDGEQAWKNLKELLEHATLNNLFDNHPPFQIDGNLGAVAAVSELLLQSHMGYIQLLPALPAAWQKGSFTGLCARGGFELDLTWEQAKVTGLVLRTMHDKVCRIRTEAPQQILAVDQSSKINGQDGSEEAMAKADNISWNEKNGIVEFAVKKEKEYHILF